jgi:hypothetical protein
MTHKQKIDAANRRLWSAEDDLRKVQNRLYVAIDDATNKVKADFQSEMTVAQSRVAEAQKDIEDAKLESRHKWEGKKVVLRTKRYERFTGRVLGVDETFGVVETRTHETVIPERISYRVKIGEPFVRLLKKDGTIGKAIDNRMCGSFDEWQLVEGQS